MANASDPAQVKKAAERQRADRELELADLKSLLESPTFRRWAWRLIGHCKVLETIWEASAKIHYNSGRQDVGHFVLAELESANIEAVFEMQKEAKKREENRNA